MLYGIIRNGKDGRIVNKKIIRRNAYGPRIFRNAYNYVHRNDDVYYYPIYNVKAPMSQRKLKIFNEDGAAMDTFFIRDFHRASNPNWNNGKYFIWDRYNYGLDTHFYSHQAMLETMGKPDRKYGIMMESRAVAPEDYNIFKKNKGLEKEFKSVFTYDDKLLNEVENAAFYPVCAAVWYGVDDSPAILDAKAYEKKDKNISIVSSAKASCDLHRFRIETARLCKREGIADTFGTFDGGKLCGIEESLTRYRYSIAIENFISDYFFCEKITNCFAAQTIPIYLGARKIGDFFNTDGIIQIKTEDISEIENIVKQCDEKEYIRRLPAVLDNYQRVQEYLNMDDYLYLHFMQ